MRQHRTHTRRLHPPEDSSWSWRGPARSTQTDRPAPRGEYVAQTVAALDNLEVTLSDVGASLTNVVGTRVLVATADRADLSTVWTVVADRFGEHDVPSTLLGVTVLGYPDQLVEVEAIAALPKVTAQRSRKPVLDEFIAAAAARL